MYDCLKQQKSCLIKNAVIVLYMIVLLRCNEKTQVWWCLYWCNGAFSRSLVRVDVKVYEEDLFTGRTVLG